MIRRRDIAWVAVWALGTVGAAALIWGSGRSVANDVQTPPAPVFQTDGVNVRIEPIAEAPLRLGEPARVRLVAENPGSADVSSRVRVQLMATAPSSPLSRVLPFPRSFYECERDLIVRAGQSLVVELTSEQPVPAGSITAVISDAARSQQEPAGNSVPVHALTAPGAVVFGLGSTVPEGQVAQAQVNLAQVNLAQVQVSVHP